MVRSSAARFIAIFASVVMVATACGGSSSPNAEAGDDPAPTTSAAPATTEAVVETTEAAPETTAAPTTSAAPTTTAEELVWSEINESFVGAPAQPYSASPIVEGEVKVYFNNGTDGTIVAVYHGAGLADPTGLCPGNSLFAGGFDFVSNAPAAEGACDGFPTDVGSVRVCTSNVWLYNTMIPNDSVGDLYGSLETLTATRSKG